MSSRLSWLAAPPEMIRKRDDILSAAERHQALDGRVLNIGSKNVRVGRNCTNFDLIAGASVDVVGDAHELTRHFGPETFDTVVLSAVLQYCEEPKTVIEQAAQVLAPGGLLLIDAPFLQPYCRDGADLWRFTADGLRWLCEPHFRIVEIKSSIGTGPAAAFIFQGAASRMRNRPLAVGLTWLVSILLYPLRYWQSPALETAGAILLVARKRTEPQLNSATKVEAIRPLACPSP